MNSIRIILSGIFLLFLNSLITVYLVIGFSDFERIIKGEGLIDVPCITFPEFAKDDDFYDDLIDGNGGDPNEIIFRKYKELMDMEFPDVSISVSAQLGDEEWLMCPLCIDAWQSKNFQDALVRCPFCETIFNNPRYAMQ
jgi:hypothetical protein